MDSYEDGVISADVRHKGRHDFINGVLEKEIGRGEANVLENEKTSPNESRDVEAVNFHSKGCLTVKEEDTLVFVRVSNMKAGLGGLN